MKQFSILQEKSALKVGTDGVLLGAYVGRHYPYFDRILDVGTGTGVIALMLAQSLPHAFVDGIELDLPSAEEASLNAIESPYHERVSIYLGNYCTHDFAIKKYDLIVSNPPYFTETHYTADDRETTAKHMGELTPATFFGKSAEILSTDGKIAIIIATSAMESFMSSASESGFYPERVVYIQTIPHRLAKRVIIVFGRASNTPFVEVGYITIQNGGARHDYTKEYEELLSPFLTIFP